MDIEMDKKELMFMNSPIRQVFQKYYEFKIFRTYLEKNSIDLTNSVIVDAGCGSGYSSKLIVEEFHPRELYAFDIAHDMIEKARKRELPATFFVGDVTNIDVPSGTCDAVFVFAFLHHVPGWKKALNELSRILKRGGVLLIEELDKKTADDAERFLKIRHSKEARFEWPEFIIGLEEAGFSVVEEKKIYAAHFRSFMCIKNKE